MRQLFRLTACVLALIFFTIKAYSFAPNAEQSKKKTETYDPVPIIMH